MLSDLWRMVFTSLTTTRDLVSVALTCKLFLKHIRPVLLDLECSRPVRRFYPRFMLAPLRRLMVERAGGTDSIVVDDNGSFCTNEAVFLAAAIIGEKGCGKSWFGCRASSVSSCGVSQSWDDLLENAAETMFYFHDLRCREGPEPVCASNKGQAGKIINSTVGCHLYELGPQEAMDRIRHRFSFSSVLIVCVDLTAPIEQANVGKWVNLWRESCLVQCSYHVVLVGTKCDMAKERVVTKQQLGDMAKQCQCCCIEVSAMHEVNVDEVFRELARISGYLKYKRPRKRLMIVEGGRSGSSIEDKKACVLQ